ncbi:MAG TPA: phosphoglycerate kinase [Candidatus Bathyarchaeota archaeon]|nr:phosphoglycerate kinase [Candidatus Bathyarchaeota archaeon]
MVKFLTLDDVDVSGKTVIVRPDFNVPIDPETREILDDTRIREHARTIKELVEKGAKVVIIAHQGRPGEPEFMESLEKHARALERALGRPVKYVHDLYGPEAKEAIKALKPGEVLVLKNVRTFPEERKKKSPEEHAKSELVRELAPLADVFVLDGFSVAHRAHASVVGFAAVLPAVAGRVMERELRSLERALEKPEKPCIFVLGGAKAEKCVDIIRYVLENNIADKVLTGGLVGHLFLKAKGIDLGRPSEEVLEKKGLIGLVDAMKELLDAFPGKIEVPRDVAYEIYGDRGEVYVKALPVDHPIYDIGLETAEHYASLVKDARSVVVSGPMGVYEKPMFLEGTWRVFNAVAKSSAFSLAGGGDTVAALKTLGLFDKFSFVSLAGGAFIEYLMGKKLPGVEVLEKAAEKAGK